MTLGIYGQTIYGGVDPATLPAGTPDEIKRLMAIEEKPFYGEVKAPLEGGKEPEIGTYWQDVPSPFGGNELWTFDDVRLAKTAWVMDKKILTTRSEAQAYFTRYRELNPVNTWKDDLMDTIKGAASVIGIVGGAAAAGTYLTPTLSAPVAAPVAPSTSIFSEYSVAELAAYDASIAEGAAAGVGLAPLSTGAESLVSETGLFSSISSGLKSSMEYFGIAGLAKSALTSGQQGISAIIDREVSSLFGGSEGQGGGSVSVTTGGIAEKMSMLPWLLVGITLLGAFILTKKGRKV